MGAQRKRWLFLSRPSTIGGNAVKRKVTKEESRDEDEMKLQDDEEESSLDDGLLHEDESD